MVAPGFACLRGILRRVETPKLQLTSALSILQSRWRSTAPFTQGSLWQAPFPCGHEVRPRAALGKAFGVAAHAQRLSFAAMGKAGHRPGAVCLRQRPLRRIRFAVRHFFLFSTKRLRELFEKSSPGRGDARKRRRWTGNFRTSLRQTFSTTTKGAFVGFPCAALEIAGPAVLRSFGP